MAKFHMNPNTIRKIIPLANRLSSFRHSPGVRAPIYAPLEGYIGIYVYYMQVPVFFNIP